MLSIFIKFLTPLQLYEEAIGSLSYELCSAIIWSNIAQQQFV